LEFPVGSYFLGVRIDSDSDWFRLKEDYKSCKREYVDGNLKDIELSKTVPKYITI